MKEWTRLQRGVILGGSALVALLLTLLAFARSDGQKLFLDNAHWTLAGLVSTYIGWIAYKKSGSKTVKWFAIGLACFLVGQIIWAVQVYFNWLPFPGPSDAFFILQPVALLVGLLAEIKNRLQRSQIKAMSLDVATLTVASLALTLAIYLPKRGSASIFSLSVLTAYPVLLVLVSAVGLLAVLHLRPLRHPSWFALLIGLVGNAVNWMVWNAHFLDNSLVNGSLMNASFTVVAYILAYAAATWSFVPTQDIQVKNLGQRMLRLLPMFAVVIACIAVLTVQIIPGMPSLVQTSIGLGAIVVIILSIARQSLIVSELQTSETRFGLAISGSSVGVWDWDLRTNEMFYSDRYLELLGFERDEVKPSLETIDDLTHPDDKKRGWAMVKEHLENRTSYQAEFRIRTKDRGYRWFLARGQAIWDARGIAYRMAGSIMDIHDRMESEEQQRLLSAAINSAPYGVVISDAQSTEMPIVYANPAFMAITQYPYAEVIGKNCRLLQGPDTDPVAIEQLKIALSGHEPILTTLLNYRKDGSAFWNELRLSPVFDASGVATHFVGILSDISEKMEQERSRRETEAQYAAFFKNLPMETIIIKLFRNEAGEVIDGLVQDLNRVNPHAPFTQGDIKGKMYSDAFGEENLQGWLNSGRTLIASGGYSQRETYFPLYDRHFLVTSFFLPGDLLVHSAIDITESKLREIEIKEQSDFNTAIMESLPGVLFLIDESSKLQHWNANMNSVTGYSDDEIRAFSPFDLIAPQDQESAKENVVRVFEKGSARVELLFKRKDGTEIPYTFSGTLIEKEGSKLLLGFAFDISDRIAAEQELVRTSAFQKAILENAGHAIISSDPTGIITHFNPTAERLLGYSAEEMVGRLTPMSFHDPLEIEAKAQELSEKLGRPIGLSFDVFTIDEDGENEWTYIRKDGTRFPVLLSVTRLTDDAGNIFGYMGIAADISEQKKALQQLAESEEKFSKVFKTVPEIISITQLSTGRFLDVNPGFEQQLGYSRDELIGYTSKELGLWADWDKRTVAVNMALEKGILVNHEIPFVRKDGAVRTAIISLATVEFNGESCLLLIGRDITEERLSQDKLAESEERFRNIIERTPMGVILFKLTNDSELILSVANQSAERILKVDVSSLIGKNILEAFPGLEDIDISERLIQTAKEGVPITGEELAYTHSGIDGIFEIHAFQSGFNRVAVMFLDVTERRLMDIRIRRMNADLEKRVTERTAELRTINSELESFAYSVSHDLRTPLRALDGFAKLLHETIEGTSSERQEHYIDRIRTASIRMGNIIDSLLILSRVARSSLRSEPVDLSKLASTWMKEHRILEPDRKVEFSVSEVPIVTADPALMDALIDNLLSNAWKYSRDQEIAKIEFGIESVNAETVEFYIQDNGAGFDMAHAERMFKPFQRLHREDEFEGTGIGLATVQRILQRHGGTIRAESAVGKGARFVFGLSNKAN